MKFQRTGNIYMCCYEGTSDILNPFICTPEECYDEKFEWYCSITYCRDLSKGRSWAFPDGVTDLDNVEIYSDYGGGFYWSGTGSESLMMIKDGINTFEEEIEETFEVPDWVRNFMIDLVGTWYRDDFKG